MHMSMEIYPRTAAERAMKLQTLVQPRSRDFLLFTIRKPFPLGNINRSKGLTIRACGRRLGP